MKRRRDEKRKEDGESGKMKLGETSKAQSDIMMEDEKLLLLDQSKIGQTQIKSILKPIRLEAVLSMPPKKTVQFDLNINYMPETRRSPKKRVCRRKDSKWSHDKYDEQKQQPKTKHEIIGTYGRDIRNDDRKTETQGDRKTFKPSTNIFDPSTSTSGHAMEMMVENVKGTTIQKKVVPENNDTEREWMVHQQLIQTPQTSTQTMPLLDLIPSTVHQQLNQTPQTSTQRPINMPPLIPIPSMVHQQLNQTPQTSTQRPINMPPLIPIPSMVHQQLNQTPQTSIQRPINMPPLIPIPSMVYQKLNQTRQTSTERPINMPPLIPIPSMVYQDLNQTPQISTQRPTNMPALTPIVSMAYQELNQTPQTSNQRPINMPPLEHTKSILYQQLTQTPQTNLQRPRTMPPLEPIPSMVDEQLNQIPQTNTQRGIPMLHLEPIPSMVYQQLNQTPLTSTQRVRTMPPLEHTPSILYRQLTQSPQTNLQRPRTMPPLEPILSMVDQQFNQIPQTNTQRGIPMPHLEPIPSMVDQLRIAAQYRAAIEIDQLMSQYHYPPPHLMQPQVPRLPVMFPSINYLPNMINPDIQTEQYFHSRYSQVSPYFFPQVPLGFRHEEQPGFFSQVPPSFQQVPPDFQQVPPDGHQESRFSQSPMAHIPYENRPPQRSIPIILPPSTSPEPNYEHHYFN